MDMPRLNTKAYNLDLIQIIQNPSSHLVVKYQPRLLEIKVDYKNIQRWIAFENQFSVENISGLTGRNLHQLVCLLCVMNLQAGVATRFMDKVGDIPRNKLLSLYYKYESIRKKILNKNVFEIMATWLYENSFISELELVRLLGYKQRAKDIPSVDDINHKLMEKEIPKYVEAYWSKTD